jgi:hypothetical protein
MATKRKRKEEPVDWDAIEKLMQRCKRGQGYVPERHEDELIRRAIRTDYKRYSALADRVMAELRAELAGKAP